MDIAGHKLIHKYWTKNWDIPKEEDADNDADLLKIREGNIKVWYVLLYYIPFGIVKQYNENAHETWMARI